MKFEFDTKSYINQLKKSNSYFHTFINRNSLAAGILVLQPNEEDTQEPHDSDELYYVIKGDGFLKINQRDYPVEEGKIFFVPKNIQHCFFGNKRANCNLFFWRT